MTRRPAFVLLLSLLAGCSVDPPIRLEEDATHAELGEALPDDLAWAELPVAIAPVSLSYLRPGEALYLQGELEGSGASAQGPPEDSLGSTEEAAPGSFGRGDGARPLQSGEAGEPGAAEEGGKGGPKESARLAADKSWTRPRVDPQRLQERLTELLAWSLYRRDAAGLPRLAASDVEPDLSLLPEEGDRAKALRGLRRRAICRAADERLAPLVLHLEVIENRIGWARRDGLWWWTNLVWFWGFGAFPVLFVSDEIYQADLGARLTVHHARSGRLLFSEVYRSSHSQSLNDAQRGWSLPGFFWLHDQFLDPSEGDFGVPYRALLPHALKELERQIVSGLRERLPKLVAANRDIFEEGDAEHTRTYAIVIGANGPGERPLAYAERDAESLADLLVERGVVESEQFHLERIIGAEAGASSVLAAIDALAPRVLGLDRLIVYYAGYGTTDDQGPVLLLDGEDPLPLRDLAQHCHEQLTRRPQVLFVLDTSFGAEPAGRSYPSERAAAAAADPGPGARDYLSELAVKATDWRVLAAAGPNETALEIEGQTEETQHGLFSYLLLEGLRGAADREGNSDGVVLPEELRDYLSERVPPAARMLRRARQRPVLRGAETELPVAWLAGRGPSGASSPRETPGATTEPTAPADPQSH